MAVSVTDAVIIINDLIYHLMLFTLSSSDDSSVKSVVLVSTMNEMLSYEPLHSIFTSLWDGMMWPSHNIEEKNEAQRG